MRFQTWLLTTLGAIAALGSTASSDILEVDLVFPRNETYTPTEWFPVVFAFQNPIRAQYLNFDVTYYIRPIDHNSQNDTITRSHDLRFANWSSHDPFFAHAFHTLFDSPGRWRLIWTLTWQSCDEEGFPRYGLSQMVRNSTDFSTDFTIQEAGKKVDLVAATSETSCPDSGFETAIAINVTDQTMDVPTWVRWSAAERTNNTCVVVKSMPTTPDPCKVDVDQTVVESMQASLKARLCPGFNPPDDCPEDDEGAARPQRGSVLGVSGLLVLSGVLWFFSLM
ncbi:hypothetical protein BDW67DRAFT_18492 [Aspergillus spinulosporus]